LELKTWVTEQEREEYCRMCGTSTELVSAPWIGGLNGVFRKLEAGDRRDPAYRGVCDPPTWMEVAAKAAPAKAKVARGSRDDLQELLAQKDERDLDAYLAMPHTDIRLTDVIAQNAKVFGPMLKVHPLLLKAVCENQSAFRAVTETHPLVIFEEALIPSAGEGPEMGRSFLGEEGAADLVVFVSAQIPGQPRRLTADSAAHILALLGDRFLEDCPICAEQVPRGKMRQICRSPACGLSVCEACCRKMFGQFGDEMRTFDESDCKWGEEKRLVAISYGRRGRTLEAAGCGCPYCRTPVTVELARFVGNDLLGLAVSRKVAKRMGQTIQYMIGDGCDNVEGGTAGGEHQAGVEFRDEDDAPVLTVAEQLQAGRKICLCRNFPVEFAQHFVLPEYVTTAANADVRAGAPYELRPARNCSIFFEKNYQVGACAHALLVPEEEQELLACSTCVEEKFFQIMELEARARNGAPNDAFQNAVDINENPNIRSCPFRDCPFVAERIGGCAHMTCGLNPAHHFCILCGFKCDDGQMIYRHMSEHVANGEFSNLEVWGWTDED